MTVFANPRFLQLAMKAQDEFGKARRLDDKNSIEGQFLIFDMLDMLDKDMKGECCDKAG